MAFFLPFPGNRFEETFLKKLSVVVPSLCPFCSKKPFDETPGMLCADCLESLPFLPDLTCPGCGGGMDGILDLCPKCLAQPPRPWKQAWSLLKMEGTAREFITLFKYRNRPELAYPLGKLLGDKLLRNIPPDVCGMVPVPLHWSRYLRRRYNQAGILCDGISAATGLPVIRGLRRVRWTKQQAKLNRDERIENLADAFSAIHSNKYKNRAILVVDDVLTTGTTLASAASTLLGAGASQVYAVSLARR